MLRLLPSAFHIAKVWKWKAKFLIRVNVKALAFCIPHSGSVKPESKMLSHMNVEAFSSRIPHSGSAEVERKMFKLYND